MKMSNLSKKALKIAAIPVFAMAVASQVSAAPIFTVNPIVLGYDPTTLGEPLTFDADFISGISSELLTLNGNTQTATGSGWLNFTSFSLAGTPVLSFESGLGFAPLFGGYGLYLTFGLTAQLTSGPFGQAGSEYALTQLDFLVYADPDLDTTFTQASALTNTAATVTPNGVDQIVGGGSLITGVAGFDDLFGAYLNSVTGYANSSLGDAYFIDPVPFYDLAFNAFNNTSQGVQKVGTCAPNCTISVTQAIGGVDFNRVPEPATLALLAVGLLGVGASTRRRQV